MISVDLRVTSLRNRISKTNTPRFEENILRFFNLHSSVYTDYLHILIRIYVSHFCLAWVNRWCDQWFPLTPQNVACLLIMERFSCECRTYFHVCFVLALLGFVIGWQNSWNFLNQWETKPKPIVPRSHVFSRAWHRLHVFTSSSDW